jgi:hypothetical protein
MPRYMLDDGRTALDRVGGGSAPAAPVPDTRCYSCGKPAAIQLHVGAACGRCALLTSGDTLGTIAAVVLNLGAA